MGIITACFNLEGKDSLSTEMFMRVARGLDIIKQTSGTGPQSVRFIRRGPHLILIQFRLTGPAQKLNKRAIGINFW